MSIYARGLVFLACLSGCDRDAVYETSIDPGAPVATTGALHFAVAGPNELLSYDVSRDALNRRPLTDRPVLWSATPDGRALVVVTADGLMTHIVTGEGGAAGRARTYALEDAFESVSFSNDGRYAVFHFAAAAPRRGVSGTRASESVDGLFVRNPNALAIVDLEEEAGPTNPTRRTLKAFGSGPTAVVVTDETELDGRPIRLAYAFAERYVVVFDVGQPEAVERVVHLTLADDARSVLPLEVVPLQVEGRPSALVRASATDNIFLLTFGAADSGVPRPELNALPGGIGLRALLPVSTSSGLRIVTANVDHLGVVDPQTGSRRVAPVSTPVSEMIPFEGADGRAAALLWSPGSSGVGYVDLDSLSTRLGQAITPQLLPVGIDQLHPVAGLAQAVAVARSTLIVLDFESQSATPFQIGGTNSSFRLEDVYVDALTLTVFARVAGSPGGIVSIALETGVTTSVTLHDVSQLFFLSEGRDLAALHEDAFGRVSRLPAASLGRAKPTSRGGLYFSEIFDR